MSDRINVLDHGFVFLVESWGSDERIIESARMSTQKSFEGWGPLPCSRCGQPASNAAFCSQGGTCDNKPGDEKLLAYLWNNKHATPFEMAGATFEIQAPIFVFREWHRHRTQSFSEMSARYAPLPDVNYIPTVERLMMNADRSNKQAGTIKGAMVITDTEALAFRTDLLRIYRDAQELYERALCVGVPKELARVHLPVGRYSRMRASANLRNWLGFLTLRLAPSAQYEIREFAYAVASILAAKFPRTYELFHKDRP